MGAGVAATIEDVAREAGVSVATVSRALRGLPNVAPRTRAKVVAAAARLHYVADPQASRLAFGRTHTIGVVVPRIGRWYYGRVFDAIHDVVASEGFDLLPLAVTDADEREHFFQDRPFRKRVDALVIVDVEMNQTHLRDMAAADLPIVTIGFRTDEFSSIRVDNRRGMRTGLEHLTGLGHTRIGLLGDRDPGPLVSPAAPARATAFMEGMAARGLEVDPELLVAADLTMSGGAAAMQRLLQVDRRPTAVMAMCDEMAVGAMQVARDYGVRVPEDVSVIGFDDHEVAEFVGLTTIRQDVVAQGEHAARQVLDALAGSPGPSHETLPAQLVVRRTTTASTARTPTSSQTTT